MFGFIIASTLVQVIGLVILVVVAAVAAAKIKVARAERAEAAREDEELLNVHREQQRIAEELAASAAATRAREEVIYFYRCIHQTRAEDIKQKYI